MTPYDAPLTSPARGQLRSKVALLDYLLGGRAKFTVVSKRTGERFTYRVGKAQQDDAPGVYFVAVLAGQDNERDFRFAGTLFTNSDGRLQAFRSSRKAKVSWTAPSVLGFRWLVSCLITGKVDPLEQAEFWHEGKCGRCGRTLTVPESIQSGFGPECRAVRSISKTRSLLS